MAATRRDSDLLLSPADARAMLRLADAVHTAPPGPASRKMALLDGLCRLVRADAARLVVTAFDPATGGRTVVSEVRAGPPPAGPGAGDGSPAAAPAPAGPGIDSFVSLSGMRVTASLTVSRRASGRRFTPRDRVIVEVLHSETAWVYGHDLMRVSPEVLALPARQRQVLQLLLAGETERRIAARLSLSPNTVHHYVKALYRRFDVSGRADLAARWERGGVMRDA